MTNTNNQNNRTNHRNSGRRIDFLLRAVLFAARRRSFVRKLREKASELSRKIFCAPLLDIICSTQTALLITILSTLISLVTLALAVFEIAPPF